MRFITRISGPGSGAAQARIVVVVATLLLAIAAAPSATARGVVKTAPSEAPPGHPFTVIDTTGRRLVPGTTAFLRLGDYEFPVPLRTHKPFDTAKGRIPDDAYNGTYDVVVRQPTGLEFPIGTFTVVGSIPPPPDVTYDFNDAARATAEIGPAGGSLSLDDGYGSRFTLEVPAGALAATTEISLTGVVSASNFPADFRVLNAVRLQPAGLTFDGSARLTIDLPESSRSGYPAVAFLSNDDGTRLTFLPLTGTDPVAAALSDSSVSLDLAHFSVAGAAEAYDGSGFPPPPANATAEERAMAVIAARMAALLESGGDPFSDDQIAAALSDWFSNPNDGLQVRLEEANASPERLSVEQLRRLASGEATRLLAQAREYLSGTRLQLLEADLLEAIYDLFKSYHTELTLFACEQDTKDAQHNLNELNTLIGEFDDGALESDFADDSFFCSYQVIFQNVFEPVFVPRPPIEIVYEIRLQDTNTFNGSPHELSSEYGIPEPQIVMENGDVLSDDYSAFLIQHGPIGPASLSVKIADSPEAKVDFLWVPSFLGPYVIAGQGTASNCIDDFDAGAGGGVRQGIATIQSLLGATQTTAQIQFVLFGPTLTSFVANVYLDHIENGQASGLIDGELSYAYEEYDEEDQRSYPVEGRGNFAGGIIVRDSTTRIANVTYAGSSNWCTSYAGTATIISQ